MRNPNGYGGIIKLSGNRRTPWAVRRTKYLDPDTGRQVYEYLGYFKERPNAILFLAQYNNDPSIIKKIPTLDDIYKRFIYDLERKDKAKSTLDMYKTSYIYFEHLKQEKITDIKSMHIQDIINDLIDEEKSYSTVHKIKVLASQLYKLAMADDYIDKNYAQFVDLPKKPKPDKSIFTDKEIDSLFKLAKTNEWATTILIMIYTAMRPNEMLSTTKFNVHLDEDYLISGIKTDAGTDRTIPIHPRIKPFIKYWSNKGSSEYLINRKNISVSYRYYLEYLYYPTLEKAEVTKLTPQKCRKTGITRMKKAGADDLFVQQVVGHEDYSTTAKYYTSVDLEELKRAINSVK